MQRKFAQDWLNSFRIAVVCSVLPFISRGKQSNQCTLGRMSLPSWKIHKCKQIACSVVVACLLVYPLFFFWYCIYTDYYFFVFVAFAYHFKNSISIFIMFIMSSCRDHLRVTDFCGIFSSQFYLKFSFFLPKISWEELAEEIIKFRFVEDVWPGVWTLT